MAKKQENPNPQPLVKIRVDLQLNPGSAVKNVTVARNAVKATVQDIVQNGITLPEGSNMVTFPPHSIIKIVVPSK